MKVLGIDPGNYKTGFSILEINSGKFRLVASGVIKAKKKPENLKVIFDGLEEIILKYNPAEIALESSFFGKNPQSLIRLGEVRGVILYASVKHNLQLFEYTPQQVKNAITGYGWADKDKVLENVENIFNVKINSKDQADAIAVSFCHFLKRYKNEV